MFSVSSILDGINAVTAALPKGVTIESLAHEVQTGFNALKAKTDEAILNGVESIAKDAITALVPGGAQLIAIVELMKKIPGFHSMNEDDPIFKARFPNPNDPGYVTGSEGGGE